MQCPRRSLRRLVLAVSTAVSTALPVCAQARSVADAFDQKIAPVLATCLECHRGASPEAGLDLSRHATALRGGESGPAIVAGDPETSLLWQRIEADEMPPKHPLSAADKAVLREWIAGGARWGRDPIDPYRYTTGRRAGYDWWSLAPLARPPVPRLDADSWSRNAVDRFVLARLRAAGLEPSPSADPRQLVRRLYIDLIGLPPPVSVLDAFARDPSDAAYGRLVDELLGSVHYGERWARHWLDVVRFGESHGFEYNQPRDAAWHYRDWVIRALNDDMPYDRFARMQLAGDVYEPDTVDGAAAVGFLVAGPHNTVLGKSKRMKAVGRHEALEELAGTVAQTFLGLTVNCARCHDHKFDPIPTRDYYRFIAALDGVTHGRREIRATPKGKTGVFTVVPGKPGVMRVHLRGDVTRPAEPVTPGGMAAVRGVAASFGIDQAADDAARRRGLAEWISHRDNGPFHRVAVNRVWHYHFGRGLVATPSDLGFNGARPSHPELLEWLAVWFRDQGYSLKKLHELIVTSATYRQSSAARPAAARIDEGNRLLWRQNPRRVEAEVLRDAMLAIAGQLDRTAFGPGYRDVKIVKVGPAFYYAPIDPVGRAAARRTIYRWHVRGQRSALLDTFDCPDPSAPTPVRITTTTPSQALSHWNDRFVLRMAAALAARIERTHTRAGPQVEQAWRLVHGRRPTPDERSKAVAFVRRHGLPLLCRVLFNSNEFVVVD